MPRSVISHSWVLWVVGLARIFAVISPRRNSSPISIQFKRNNRFPIRCRERPATPAAGDGSPIAFSLGCNRFKLIERVPSLWERMAEGQVREGFETSRFLPSPERGRKRRAPPSPGGKGFVLGFRTAGLIHSKMEMDHEVSHCDPPRPSDQRISGKHY